jgi:prepilin-type N-terminal cleavage/methylation domain-containing protein
MKRRSFAHRRGFTLVELMISLVMGLIVALAAVGLARTATTTFYEQARISGVEANVRAASERLRSDLSRVSYMSTPNIQWDTKVALVPGTYGAPYRIPALTNLQGIRIDPATTVRSHPYSAQNSIQPQEVIIAGNLTSDDVYRGVLLSEGTGCGGTTVRLSSDADAAVRRLFNGATTPAEQLAMTHVTFMPGERMNPPLAGLEYAVQVMDMRGCFHYLTICGVAPAPERNSVVLLLNGGILTTAATGGDVCGARMMEEVAIAPVQRVRWALAPETDAHRIDTTLDGPGAPNKFNLTRQLLAADGVAPVGPPEVVAEYGVDLKFGLIVDNTPVGGVGGPRTYASINFEDNDAAFSPWAGPATTSTQATGPHRIRSVRYRLAFRTPFADRQADLPMPGGPPYISRYKMGNATEWARVRTVISEVALLNQSRTYFSRP